MVDSMPSQVFSRWQRPGDESEASGDEKLFRMFLMGILATTPQDPWDWYLLAYLDGCFFVDKRMCKYTV